MYPRSYLDYWLGVAARTGGGFAPVRSVAPVPVVKLAIPTVFYVRDDLVVTAAIAAAVEYARVWDQGQTFYGAAVLAEPGPLTKYDTVWVHSLDVRIVNPLGYWTRRGSKIELVNLTDQPGERATLRTSPANGVQGFNGVAYEGPPFLCPYACGWWVAFPALSENDHVYMRIGYTTEVTNV